MKEVKSPKKPLIYYYGVVLLVLLVFNLVITPLLLKQEVTEVDYGTFMSMTESKNIGQVQVEDQQIVFTDKDEKNVYQTNVMDDPSLTERPVYGKEAARADGRQGLADVRRYGKIKCKDLRAVHQGHPL